MINWISVKDKLPPLNTRILIWGEDTDYSNESNPYMFNIWEAEIEARVHIEYWIDSFKITHWAEYPNKPIEDEPKRI